MATTAPLSHDVFVQRSGSAGFEYESRLRCLSIQWTQGPAVGSATLAFVSESGDPLDLTEFFRAVGPDDRVRVRVDPLSLERLAPVLRRRATVFEGVVVRRNPWVQSAGGEDTGGATVVCWSTAHEDNLAADHTVTGRWTAPGSDPGGSGGAGVQVIEAMDLPAVFNFRGRPNRHGSATLTGGGLTASVFTHDGDPAGQAWSVGQALGSILAQWLVRDGLARSIDLDPVTVAALNAASGGGGTSGGTSGGERWLGLTDTLPEVNVHGLGVLDALQAVCLASGYRFSVMPDYDDVGDALHLLRVYRAGAGPDVELKLARRGTVTASDDLIRHHSVSRLVLNVDSGASRPAARVVGASMMEVTVELRPLWRPEDAETPDLSAQMQEPTPGSGGTSGGSVYHDKHVAGGAEFLAYAHVGRRWGVDCVGAGPGYDDGPYQHPGEGGGFDWVAELGLDGGNLAADRAEQGVTDPIVWTRRPRALLPLQRNSAVLAGSAYHVEVSEDGGQTWVAIPLKVRSDGEQCSLMLLGIDNLAAVNTATFATGVLPPVEESWWALMFPADAQTEPQLRLRVTACVRADHAAVAHAPRRSTAAVTMDRLLVAESGVQELWAAPSSVLNVDGSAGGDFLAGYTPHETAFAQAFPVLAQAQRARDTHDGLRVAGAAYTWVMDIGRWRVGDRVAKINGIDLDLHTSRSERHRAPSIAGVTVTLWPEDSQGIGLDFSDDRVRGGYGGGR